MGKPELATDPRYATQIERCKRRPEVRQYIEDWLQSFEDDDTPLKILEKARIPSAPILDIPATVAHPQLQTRDFFQDVPHPLLGPTPIAKSPFHLSSAQVAIPFRAAFFWATDTTRKSSRSYLDYSRRTDWKLRSQHSVPGRGDHSRRPGSGVAGDGRAVERAARTRTSDDFQDLERLVPAHNAQARARTTSRSFS